MEAKELAKICAEVAEDRQGIDVITIDIENQECSAIADYFVICSGNSEPHVKAISDNIYRELRNNHDIRPRKTEGSSSSGWVITDYISVVVHVLSKEKRELYDIESIWKTEKL